MENPFLSPYTSTSYYDSPPREDTTSSNHILATFSPGVQPPSIPLKPCPFSSMSSLIGTRGQLLQAYLITFTWFECGDHGPLGVWVRWLPTNQADQWCLLQAWRGHAQLTTSTWFILLLTWLAVLFDHGPIVQKDPERDRENYKELRKQRTRRRLFDTELTLCLVPNTSSYWPFPADLCEDHYPYFVAEGTRAQYPHLDCVSVKIKPMSVLHYAFNHS